jgi:micrococcal nuclease
MTEWTVPATVERVIDGDTIAVTLDLGWEIYKHDHVRVAHIDAPELKTPEGKLARAYAETLLPVGRKIIVVSHSLDKYGRALATIKYQTFYADHVDTIDYGSEMISKGHALAWEGSGPKP